MISNVEVYGIDESLTAAGYPMATETNDIIAKLELGHKLGCAKRGSGHSTYLCGIVIQFDWQKSILIERHLLRYHFIDTVSSQSLMHRVNKFDIGKHCNEYVDKRIIQILNELIENYNNLPIKTDEEYRKLLYNVPSGFQLTARYTTNYLQLKTIYYQRRNHRLKEWQDFCDWILTLPYFKYLTGCE